MTMLQTPLPAPSASRNSRVWAIAGRVSLGIAVLWRAWKHRREVNDLLRLDDRMLKDIGLVRTDILGALEEPIGADPSVGLRLRSVENRLRQRDRADQVERVTSRGRSRPATVRPVVKTAA